MISKTAKSILCCLLCGVILLLVACNTKQQTQPIQLSNDSTYEQPDKGKDEKEHTDYRSLNQVPDTYQKTLDINLTIDAKVDVPDVDQVPILLSEIARFDEEKISNAFLEGSNVKEERHKRRMFGEDAETVIYTSIEGNTLQVSSIGGFFYSTLFSEYVRTIFKPNSPAENQVDLPKDLNFMSQQQAVEEAIRLLQSLSITPYFPPKIYALDHQILRKEQERLLKDDTFKWYVDQGKAKIKEQWNKEDDCYYMLFRNAFYGIPCDSEGYILQSADRGVNGTLITVIVSKNGIELCGIEGILYEEKEVEENSPKILSLDEAVESLKKKYNNIILTREVKVTNISFQYVPIPIENKSSEFNIVPAWIFEIHQIRETAGPNKINIISVRFNAITGKEII